MPTWKHIDPEELKRLEAMANPKINAIMQAKKEEWMYGDVVRTKSSKYRNQKTDGFDSKKEARRAEELRMLERCGQITMLTYQVPYELQPGFRDKDGVYHRPINYIADFVYIQDGKEVCEDVKSPITAKNPVYRLKRKMLLFKYADINFVET